MTIQEQYSDVLQALREVSDEPDAEAREILAHVYGLSPGRLIMRFFDTAGSFAEIRQIVAQRRTGMPLAYVLRSRDFYGRDFYVDERVLIPRSDTESVAEAAIKAAKKDGARTCMDLCCGSGCIGITILKETDVPCVLFADISGGALAVARANAERHGVLERARFRQGDMLEAADGPADLIVCNPPYISDAEICTLETQVKEYEPRLALSGGADGLDFYRRLAAAAQRYLSPSGTLIAEVGDGQAETVCGMFEDAGLLGVRAGTDVAGKDRFVIGRSI